MSTKIHASIRNFQELPFITNMLAPLIGLKGASFKGSSKDGQTWHLYIDVPDIPQSEPEGAVSGTDLEHREPGEPENWGG